jgi:hypothetical protein
MGEIGEVDRDARNDVVVGESEGSRGIAFCNALRPAAREWCTGNSRCLVRDPAAEKVSLPLGGRNVRLAACTRHHREDSC